ncbi:ABC transporter ATP-binding protein [Rhizobium sp. SEMIA 4085]|uniref:ABC transporter ATP-binding protein n=2 Tax=Rhizobium TaxID=379 RepID=A0A0B4XB78_9HYPH|nr:MULTISPECIES: ABC transporter ATP-binding protein [Rhizobium]AJD43802.1 ABC transporter ATP-binding protein [Rhizobium gallicum bv. gallicum R602sp]MBB4276634.1 putative spermidine/putrescine transport system ATP-binding protein [Rhizobium mongolense]NNH32301.1 ABC transporter ATP-binding protein [Rhizobium sp. SEMIA 4085]TDW34283.1 putative spermidine/putrescine transport system ATP-binding protein [Rhizobium azibense]
MADSVLSLQNLDVGFPGMTVVHDLNLDVADGAFVSLLGPSGSGKSTVLRTIAGLLPALGGRVALEGRDITTFPPERRNVGIVFQNYALFPTMTAFENIAFALRVAKKPKAEIEKRVHEVAAMARITDQLDKKPASMSGGQQQRVAIARALVTGSRVLLFDEPLSNLDAKVRASMRQEIKRLQTELGFTAIFVTHDQEDALTMSDVIVVLNHGKIEQIGDGRTLYRKPATPFICEFIGVSNELAPQLAARLLGSEIKGRSFVRLEDVMLSATAGIPARVKHVEFLGAYSRIDLDVEGHALSAMLIGDPLPDPGSTVPLAVRPGAAHIFAEAIP